MVSVLCIVEGLVQGVGFRPFVYRSAVDLGLYGTVENRTEGVRIVLQGERKRIDKFVHILKTSPPPASDVSSVGLTEIELPEFEEFRILKSGGSSKGITEVSPDIAVCEECLTDLKKQEHRINYPFINCTNCGPRFTITKALPYDRFQTTMEPFRMCTICREEYDNPMDRRFHAQPVACIGCGPKYSLHKPESATEDLASVIISGTEHIDGGNILAMKGLGGFHLVCDALNPDAVNKMRLLKNRETKPFALMVRDIAAAEKYTKLREKDKELLSSWKRPIVLLEDRRNLPTEINRGLSVTGIMLPYMPFHHLLFEKLETDCIVATSGNFSDEPIIIDNTEALGKFLPLTGCVIVYNRDIHNRCDDSVGFTVNGKPRLIRRSRGWTPRSIPMKQNCDGILAVGGELKNTFCLGKGNRAILSQHIGDLKSFETEIFFKESIDRLSGLFNVKPAMIIHDLHPDYLSTRFARESGLPVMGVQHHWAHIASCLAEHRVDRKVIGFAFDGTGYGTDGAIWGGEVLVCDLHNYERYTHLEYIPLPGGDAAVKEPWRMGVSWLYKVFGESFRELELPLLSKIKGKELETVITMIKKGINSPLTSSMGRLFDAVSAIAGICLYSGFEAEAAMRLESEANDPNVKYALEEKSGTYPFEICDTIHISEMIEGIVRDTLNGLPKALVSYKFHNTISEIILAAALKLRDEKNLNSSALSGGVFYNKRLLTLAENKLEKAGFEVITNSQVPAGDGGISLGQCAIGGRFSFSF